MTKKTKCKHCGSTLLGLIIYKGEGKYSIKHRRFIFPEGIFGCRVCGKVNFIKQKEV